MGREGKRGSENCTVVNVDVKASWRNGRRDAAAILSSHPDFKPVKLETFSSLGQEGVTMFRPDGFYVASRFSCLDLA